MTCSAVIAGVYIESTAAHLQPLSDSTYLEFLMGSALVFTPCFIPWTNTSWVLGSTHQLIAVQTAQQLIGNLEHVIVTMRKA